MSNKTMRTFGKQPVKMPAGFFKAVHFPTLALLDKQTGDHRLLSGEGADVRSLPLSIKYASKTSAMGGHDTAEVSGALFAVTIDPENGNMSGDGFLLNDENGRRHARLIATGAMSGNSVDLAEIRARFVEDLDTEDYWIEFSKFKLAATTGVATPAFAEARVEVEPLSDEELVASFGDDPMQPLIVDSIEEFSIRVVGEIDTEITASLGALAPFDVFYRPEADRPTKAIVDGEGAVYGHLALWESCHDGFADRCMRVPRPRDGYASFNKAGVLTERGHIETGPIFAFGGHRSVHSAATIEQAYGGIENAWCDVRVTEGKFGPWISGKVRPGIPDDVVYAARASRLSGHWVKGALRAIVSVNTEGFEVPGTGAEAELVAGFAVATNDDGVLELVASFPECAAAPAPVEKNQLTFTFNGTPDASQIAHLISTTMSGSTAAWTINPTLTTTVTTAQPIIEATSTDPQEDAELRAWADAQLAKLLDVDED